MILEDVRATVGGVKNRLLALRNIAYIKEEGKQQQKRNLYMHVEAIFSWGYYILYVPLTAAVYTWSYVYNKEKKNDQEELELLYIQEIHSLGPGRRGIKRCTSVPGFEEGGPLVSSSVGISRMENEEEVWLGRAATLKLHLECCCCCC